jgi:hypothetical protein
MQANRIKISVFGDDGHEYAKEFAGPEAVVDGLNWFLAQQDRDAFTRTVAAYSYAAENAMRVGEYRNGWVPKFNEVHPVTTA